MSKPHVKALHVVKLSEPYEGWGVLVEVEAKTQEEAEKGAEVVASILRAYAQVRAQMTENNPLFAPEPN